MKALALTLVLLLAFGVTFAQEEEAAKPESKIVTTESGLQYEILKPGEEGTNPGPHDWVTVHYTGKFKDGRVFDASARRGAPSTFKLGGVIEGWNEGIPLMTVGSKFRFTIPWKLAYGERGTQGIPGKTDLV